jgi:hypothetical protein
MTASTNETSPRNLTVDAPLRSVPRKDAEVTDLDKVRADRLAASRQRRSAARTRDLTRLLSSRPDLAGVHAPADFAVDALRWCI